MAGWPFGQVSRMSDRHTTLHKAGIRSMEQLTTMTAEEPEARPKVHTFWVGEEDRIVSFHAVDSYDLRVFDCHDTYLEYLCALQKRGFRFQ